MTEEPKIVASLEHAGSDVTILLRFRDPAQAAMVFEQLYSNVLDTGQIKLSVPVKRIVGVE